MTEPISPRPPMRPTAGSESTNATVVWMVLRKYWTTALVTTIGVFLVVCFYTLGTKKIYETQATLQFDPSPPRPLGQRVEAVVEMGSALNRREYYETQYKIILSMRTAMGVVDRLGLQRDAAFLANASPGVAVAPAEVSRETAGKIVQSRIKVESVRESQLAIVKCDDADPARAQRLLEALIETYITMNLEDAHASTSQAAEWLHEQLDKLKGELDTSEMSLHEYKEQKNILSVALDDQSNMLREGMRQLFDALTTVRAKREEVSARRAELMKLNSDDPSNLPSSELLSGSLLQGLRQEFLEGRRERDGLLGSGKGRNHPDVLAADGKLSAARSNLLTEIHNIQGALTSELAVLNRQEAGLSGLFEATKKEALELNLREIEYNRLKRAKDNNEKLYSLVLERSKESDLSRMLSVNNIRLVDPPLLPTSPSRPIVALNLVLGLIAGMGLGVAATVVRSALDRTIKTPEDLEDSVGISFLGWLPDVASRPRAGKTTYGRRRRGASREAKAGAQMELSAHVFPKGEVAEAARNIRTNLIFTAPDHPYRTLLVTSAVPAEGKTTVACSIAITMAQAGQRVVLVDCDLRRSRIHRLLSVPQASGLTTALLNDDVVAAADSTIFPTEIPNLSVVAAGPTPPNPAELFHSERFRKLLEELKSRFDRVIVDSPPIAIVTDGAILSTLCDGTVLVVRSFKTPKELARHALRSLTDIGANVAGAVLNSVDFSKNDYRYSRYSYYGNATRNYGAYLGEDDGRPSQVTAQKGPPDGGGEGLSGGAPP